MTQNTVWAKATELLNNVVIGTRVAPVPLRLAGRLRVGLRNSENQRSRPQARWLLMARLRQGSRFLRTGKKQVCRHPQTRRSRVHGQGRTGRVFCRRACGLPPFWGSIPRESGVGGHIFLRGRRTTVIVAGPTTKGRISGNRKL